MFKIKNAESIIHGFLSRKGKGAESAVSPLRQIFFVTKGKVWKVSI